MFFFSLSLVSGPRHSVAVGSGPVVQCVPVMGNLWVACDGTLYLFQKERKSVKVCYVGFTVQITIMVPCSL